MPELPEVEFARKQLTRWLTGAKIVRARVVDDRILDAKVKPASVVKALTGKTVKSVDRRGKWLRIVLNDGLIFSHFGMTGKWVLAESKADVRFEKIRLDVTLKKKNRSVCYVDPRLFGRFVIAKEDLKAWSALGPDPLTDGIDADVLYEKLQRRKLPIKPILLDQTVLAGVGNIQATEALYFAHVDPHRPANSISRKETGLLARGIDRTIKKTLAMQTESTITYMEEAGAKNPFLIYGHGGKPCPRCKRPLTKVELAGRGTVYCESCQK